MDDTTILGSVLGQIGQTAKKVGQQIVQVPEEVTQDVGGQFSAKQNQGESQEPKREWQSDEERKKFLRDLYGKEDMSQDGEIVTDKTPSTDAKAMADKEEQKKLMELRNQLHKENYYDPTFNPPKQQEERPAEKVENEKREDLMELQQKDAKKPPPIAVVREQNKAEQFRGAAG